MAALLSREIGRSGCQVSRLHFFAPVRTSSVQQRKACLPSALLAQRSPRRQHARLVTKNFKQSSESSEEAPVVKPKSVRHPLTEDPASGVSPAETATQRVILHSTSGGAATAAPAKVPGFWSSVLNNAKGLLMRQRPRALLRALVRNSISYGPLLIGILYFVWQPLLAFWDIYNASLNSHPLFTKIATGVVGCIIGDYAAQRVTYNDEVDAARQRGEATPAFTFDYRRTARLVTYGVLVGTPIGHAWFALLDAHVMPEDMTNPVAVFMKMALDQFIMSPINTAIFFAAMRCWEGHPGDAAAYVCRKWPSTMLANYMLWPLAHVINFSLVPPEQRILYVNVVGVLWTFILSKIQNERSPPPAGEAPAAALGGSIGPAPGGVGAAPRFGSTAPGFVALGGADPISAYTDTPPLQPEGLSPSPALMAEGSKLSHGAAPLAGSLLRAGTDDGATRQAVLSSAYLRRAERQE